MMLSVSKLEKCSKALCVAKAFLVLVFTVADFFFDLLVGYGVETAAGHPLFLFPDRLLNVFSALGEKVIS